MEIVGTHAGRAGCDRSLGHPELEPIQLVVPLPVFEEVALHRRVRQGLAREDPANGAGRVPLRVDPPHKQKLVHYCVLDGPT